MKNARIVRILTLGVIIFSLVFGGFACKKAEKIAEKGQTVADKPLPDGTFKAVLSAEPPLSSIKANSIFTIEVKVKNMSSVLWPSKGQQDGKYKIGLAYHWLDKNGKVIIWDGVRTPLPYDIKPNEEVTLNAQVKAPDKPGDYILEFDMVQERVTWFANKGDTKTLRLTFKVD